MIVKIEDVMSRPEFKDANKEQIQKKLTALELRIRKRTSNNFQNRHIRFSASSNENRIEGCHPFIRVGDTIQISESYVNDGIYVVTKIDNNYLEVDANLFSVEHNLVTKVEYPEDVQEGVMSLLLWEVENRKNVGIKTKTLSRYSVTYFDQDANNQDMGYPISLLGFLKPYMKARF